MEFVSSLIESNSAKEVEYHTDYYYTSMKFSKFIY